MNRVKNGSPSVHPLRGPELRALRRLERDYATTPYVLVTELGGPMTDSNVRKIIARARVEARLPFPVHPHVLRHACGYKLANDGARHAQHPAVFGSQKHLPYRAIHGTRAGSLQ